MTSDFTQTSTPPRTPRMMVRVEAAGQVYKQVQSITYLGSAVTETPDTFAEIARRTRAFWMRIKRYLRELYGQPKVVFSLKTRMVKAEAFEALLYRRRAWTLRQEYYAKLRTVHDRVLLRIIGAQRKRPDHRVIDAPSPEGRSKTLGEDGVERIVLISYGVELLEKMV